MFHNNFSVLKGWQGLFKKKKKDSWEFYFILSLQITFDLIIVLHMITLENSPNLSPTEELLNMLKKQVCAK